MLPANEYGLAFGQVIHGFFHKKKKGFFPASHVVELQNEAEKHPKPSAPKQESNSENTSQTDVLNFRKSLKRRKEIVPDVIHFNEASLDPGIDTVEEVQIRANESEVAKANKQAWAAVTDQNGNIEAKEENSVEGDARRRRRESRKKAREKIIE